MQNSFQMGLQTPRAMYLQVHVPKTPMILRYFTLYSIVLDSPEKRVTKGIKRNALSEQTLFVRAMGEGDVFTDVP